jgi:hypothetical protein
MLASRTSHLVILFALWLVVVAGGTMALARYSVTPGSNEQAPATWPTDSHIPFDTHRPTLTMFVHPQCPCSQASIGELEVLLARFPGGLNTHIVFLKPDGTATNWEKTALWRRASSVPEVTVHTDYGGTEARRFHAEISGQSLLYDVNGTLKFQGGITLGRGHSGDNPGRSTIEEILRDGHPALAKTPVFGCSLFEAQGTQGEIICKP